MILVNFAHPLTAAQLALVEALTGQTVERVLAAPTHFDAEQPFGPQARALVDRVGLTSEEWQTAALVVNLPGHSTAAALVLAELHGRAGYFPAVLRMRPTSGSDLPVFEPAEILNLQDTREQARRLR